MDLDKVNKLIDATLSSLLPKAEVVWASQQTDKNDLYGVGLNFNECSLTDADGKKMAERAESVLKPRYEKLGWRDFHINYMEDSAHSSDRLVQKLRFRAFMKHPKE